MHHLTWTFSNGTSKALQTAEMLSLDIKRLLKIAGFHIVIVRGIIAKMDCCSTLHVKWVYSELRKKIDFCENVDIMFRLEQGNPSSKAAFSSTTMVHNSPCDQVMKKEVMGSRNSKNVWTANSDVNAESFSYFYTEWWWRGRLCH